MNALQAPVRMSPPTSNFLQARCPFCSTPVSEHWRGNICICRNLQLL